MDKTQSGTPENIAADNWKRYKYGLERGHRDYT